MPKGSVPFSPNGKSPFGTIVESVIAEGFNPNADPIIIGFEAVDHTGGTGEIAIGEFAATGDPAFTTGDGNLAIGYGAQAGGAADNDDSNVAIGRSALAQGGGALALTGGYAPAKDSVAIGGASSYGIESIAIGLLADSDDDNAIAIGSSAFARFQAVACGMDAAASSSRAVAVGRSAIGSGDVSVAVGYLAEAVGSSAVAIGSDASSNGSSSVAIGDGSYGRDNYSTAVGHSAQSRGQYSLAIGSTALTQTLDDIAIGDSAQAGLLGSPGFNTAIGYQAQAGTSIAGTTQTLAVGYQASALHTHATAIGAGASTTIGHQVMLGTTAEFVEVPGNGIVLHDSLANRWRVTVTTGGALTVAAA